MPADRGDDSIGILLDLQARVAQLEAMGASRWGAPGWGRPPGGYASTAAGQTPIGTSFTDLTALTITFTASVSRRYLLMAHARFLQNTGAGLPEIQIQTLVSGAGASLASASISAGASGFVTLDPWVVVTPAAGSVSYHLQAKTSANTMSLIADTAQLLAIDIGPV